MKLIDAFVIDDYTNREIRLTNVKKRNTEYITFSNKEALWQYVPEKWYNIEIAGYEIHVDHIKIILPM